MNLKPATTCCLFLFLVSMGCSTSATPQLGSEANAVHTQAAVLGDTVNEMSNELLVIFQDRSGHYWFGGEGLYRYDGKYTVQYTTAHGLPGEGIRSVQEDKQGNIFVNTGAGISKFDGRTFSALEVVQDDTAGTGWQLGEDDLWFASAQYPDGPLRFDGETLYALKFPRHHRAHEFYSQFSNGSFSPYDVYTIYKAKDGAIWFGTAVLGAARFDGNELLWIAEDEVCELDNGPAPGVRSIIEDRDGNVWLSNVFHRYRITGPNITTTTQSTLPFYQGPKLLKNEQEDSSGVTHFQSAVIDSSNRMWMVTYAEGVWRFDGKEFVQFVVTSGGESINLFSIFQDAAGELWLGTHHNGIYRFEENSFVRFNP